MRDGLEIVAVPTSEATHRDAERLGVPLTTLDATPELDLTVDGADEIAPDLSLIKGGGGALLREKIVAAASARMIVIADESKWVPMLGRFPLPIEVVPFGLEATAGPSKPRPPRPVRRAARSCGVIGTATFSSRMAATGYLMQRSERIADPGGLAERLSAIPGVVEHGLFIGLARAAIIGSADGVRVVERC